jgi:hypothetical protein
MRAKARIYRPRQIYMGPPQNHYVPVEQRDKKLAREFAFATS